MRMKLCLCDPAWAQETGSEGGRYFGRVATDSLSDGPDPTVVDSPACAS